MTQLVDDLLHCNEENPGIQLHHSHNKQKDSLETRAVHIEICMLCWNLVNSPKHQGSFLDNMACTKGHQLLECELHVILDKIEADILQITKEWNRKWIV